jgi:hypothetical protein
MAPSPSPSTLGSGAPTERAWAGEPDVCACAYITHIIGSGPWPGANTEL